MNRFCPIVSLSSLVMILLLIFSPTAHAAVTVTPASSGSCLNLSPGAYLAIGDIVIQENNNGDFSSAGGSRTLILSAPANFQFQAGVGNVTYQAGRNITAASIAVAAGTITVTYTCSNTNRSDRMTISGIMARATAVPASGNIVRTGGTGTINGDATGGGVNHGTLTAFAGGATRTSIAAGNWSSPGTWSGGNVPNCNDNAVINHNVTGDMSTKLNNLTINTGGTLTSNSSITVTGTFTIAGTGTYIHNNNANAAIGIFSGTESFSTTSTIEMRDWYNTNIPLATNVSGDFGHIIFDEGSGSTWNQDGLFSPHRIKGNLTIRSGGILMDDGTGMTTTLTLQDVLLEGSGALRIAEGNDRNLTLVTNNYSDSRTSGSVFYSGIQFDCSGSVSWTANGDILIEASWSYYEGSAGTGNSVITINGDLTIDAGAFDFNRNVDASLTVVVNGNTYVNNNTTWVRFLDRYDEDISFTTTNMYVYGGANNTFHGGTNPTGDAIFNITNDLIVTGGSTVATFVSSTSNTATSTLNVGRDILLTDGDIRVSNTNSTTTINVSRNIVLTGSNSDFYGQIYSSGNKLTDLNVTGNIELNNGDFYISLGLGNVTCDIVENLDINNGRFFAINNTAAANNGLVTFSCNDLDFDGGIFHLFNGRINDGKTITATINGNLDINFLNIADLVTFIGLTGTNNPLLDLNISGNMIVNGNFPGSYFMSSSSSGNETVDIGGNLTVNAGDVFFVGNESGLTASHNITTNITGDINITGGNTRLSTGTGTADIDVDGSVSISNGTLSLKYDAGVATLNVLGSYTQSGGTFNLHSRNATTADNNIVNVFGNFLMSNGTFRFDNFASGAGLAEHSLFLYGTSFTLDGNASIIHANDLTTNYIFGQIYFSYPGTMDYLRYSNTNSINHVRYTVQPSTTLDATSSTFPLQITSVDNSTPANHFALTVNGTIDMGNQIIQARQSGSHYSRVIVAAGGRYRLSHTGGLYSGNALTASSIDGFINGNNRVNYQLNISSIVEYYGTSNIPITGIPNGVATGNNQKYGFLEINFTGVAGSTWVYPEANNEVYVRSGLLLTAGEFNLDNDHNTATGGRAITIENNATISRTSGFIRSETEDGSGIVQWDINSNGSYVVPFGYDAMTYIPFTYQQTAGASGIVSFGTYRSAADNTPFPPTVSHVRDLSGTDNSASTIDRFWKLTQAGAGTATLTFSYAAAEDPGILSPRAQLWEPVSLGWFPATAGQSNPTATTTAVPTITTLNTWWTLAAAASPLPIELLSFEAIKSGNNVDLIWRTASEINNDYFTIQKSKNGYEFEDIATVDGAGNSTSVTNYKITDTKPYNGINYYRLMQTDFDGKFTYSEIRSIFFGTKGAISVFPNPAPQNNQIQIAIPNEGEYTMNITDASGRIIQYEKIHATANNQIVPINLNATLSSGIYQIGIQNENENYNSKLIIR
ncbi:MAG: T9SS type A sorting domain-containing protein [Bacteroidetes bacterium]|nr:T9SS type A sorting domain-containing protein [Bacteroidota bacterium]